MGSIAGRSYPNVPVISRGSLEDPADFGSKTAVLVVTSQPSARQTATPPVTVLRGTLQDPPVLTTAPPVVIAAPADPRWFAGSLVQVLAAPQAPAAAPVPLVITSQPPWPATAQAAVIRGTLQDPAVLTTAAPVVVTSQPSQAQTATPPATVLRSTLQDPPVLTTAGPVVVAAAADRRWYNPSPVTVIANAQAPALLPAVTPGPLVITSQPPRQLAAQAFITRSTLQDPPVLATPGPVIVAVPADPRWFTASPARIAAGGAASSPPPRPAPVLFSSGTARHLWAAAAARNS